MRAMPIPAALRALAPIVFLVACAPAAPSSPPGGATFGAVVSARPIAAAAGSSSSSASATGNAEPPHIDRAASKAIAEKLLAKIIDPEAKGARVEDPTDHPVCEPTHCEYLLPVTASFGDLRGPIGEFHVDTSTGSAKWEPAESPGHEWDIDDYAAYAVGARKAIAAARKLKSVIQYCAELRKGGNECSVDVALVPVGSCASKPAIDDPCRWTLAIGPLLPGQPSYRFASTYVDAISFKVVGGSTLYCTTVVPAARFEMSLASASRGVSVGCQ